MTYYVNLRSFCADGTSESVNFPVCGTEAAWEAYSLAARFADFVGGEAALVDGETAEVIADTLAYDEDDEDEEEAFFEPTDLEMGFDPYDGCYTYDC